MAGFWLLILVGSLLLLIVVMHKRPASDPYLRAELNRPSILDGAVVVESKTRLAMFEPFALHGEPDIIYRTARNSLLVREDKTGFPQPRYEQIQMSVYAAILRHNPPESLRGLAVEPFGLVRYGTPGKGGKLRIRWKKVPLLTDEQLAGIIQRYRAVRRGTAPQLTQDSIYCAKKCAHFGGRCPGA